MQKLLLLLLFFVGLCLVSIMIFNASTQISLQAKIEKTTAKTIDINKAFNSLQKVLQIPTLQNNEGKMPNEHSQNLKQLLAQQFPKIHAIKEFENTTFLKHHLAYKWQGTQGNAPYIVLIAPYHIQSIEEGNFVAPQINNEVLVGSGALQSKTALVALFAAMENLAQSNFRPKRNILILAPCEENVLQTEGLRHIAAELAHFNLNYTHILYAASGNQLDNFAELNENAALIGILDKQILNLTLSSQDNNNITNALNQLQKFKIDINLHSPANQAFINYIAPESSFDKAFYFTNTWLIESLTKAIFRAESRLIFANELTMQHWKESMRDGKNAITLNLQIPAHWHRTNFLQQLDKEIFKKLNIDYELEYYLPANMPENIHNKSFELLQTTIKQVFGNYVVLPIAMDKATGAAYLQYQSQTPVLYYAPFNFTKDNYLNAYYGTEERISKADFAQMIQFYIQYVQNTNI